MGWDVSTDMADGRGNGRTRKEGGILGTRTGISTLGAPCLVVGHHVEL